MACDDDDDGDDDNDDDPLIKKIILCILHVKISKIKYYSQQGNF